MRLLTDRLRLGPVTFAGKTYSPDRLTTQIDAVARFLDRRCRGRSPIVCLFAANHIKTVAGYFGILKSGRVCLLADPGCGALEWAEMTRDAPPSAVIRFDETREALDLDGEVTHEDAASDGDLLRQLDGVCTLLFTAADDGHAKAAMLTHDNMLVNGQALVECDELGENTPTSALIPFHHLFGLQTGLVAPSTAGAPIALVDPRRLASLKGVVKELDTAGVARLYSVPALLYLLAKAWIQAEAKRLPATIGSGGVKLPVRVLERYRQAFGKEIHEGYGLTEASPICAWHRPADRIRPDSVGRAFSCCELRIEDEQGRPVAGRGVGEVCVRGENVMKGYLGHPAATQHTLRGGWLHTGDLGWLDEDGFLHLTGLKKRMLNVLGKKVYPAEVERLMRMHPDVDSVTVFGRPEELQGDFVCGRVRLRTRGPDAERAFKGWCSRSLSTFKIPSRLEFE